MFTRLRRHLGTAGLLVAVVALVAALGGGAVAAQSGGDATASAKKKKGPKFLTKAQVLALIKKNASSGPAGPAGPAGLNGTPGANGQDGSSGSNGTPGTDGDDGADGKTVLSGTVNPTSGVGNPGDFYIRTDTSQIWGPKVGTAWGAPTSLKGADGDDGDDGDPWAAGGTLPGGATQTGAWQATVNGSVPDFELGGFASVSFPIPLSAPLTNVVGASQNVWQVEHGDIPPAQCDDGVAPAPSTANPEADPGHFCVFSGGGLPEPVTIHDIVRPTDGWGNFSFDVGAGKTGSVIWLSTTLGSSTTAMGTFAVTAPLPAP